MTESAKALKTAPPLDRTAVLAEVRAVTAPRLAVSDVADSGRHTEIVSGVLRALLDATDGEQREAVRVMRRCAVRLLDAPPASDATPFTAWQYLLNLARTTQALLLLEGNRQ